MLIVMLAGCGYNSVVVREDISSQLNESSSITIASKSPRWNFEKIPAHHAGSNEAQCYV